MANGLREGEMGTDRGFWERGAYRLETGPGYFRVYGVNGRLLVSGATEHGSEVADGLFEIEALEDGDGLFNSLEVA